MKIIENKKPRNTQLALNFLEYVETSMKADPDKWGKWEQHFQNSSTTFTGHSLGGYTADWQYLQFSALENCQCVTFDNPGSYSAMIKWVTESDGDKEDKEGTLWLINEARKNSVNYVAHMNFINTCNEHLGKVYLLKDLPFNYVLDEWRPTVSIEERIDNNFYYLFYSLNQHSLLNMYKYLKEGGEVQLDNNHVIGVKVAFLDYLTLYKHNAFWNGYIRYIWDNDKDVREQFENEMPVFFTYMHDNIHKAREKAVKMNLQPKHEDIEHTNSVTKLGLFKETSKPPSIEEDFVLVNSDNPSVEYQPNKRCAIM